VTATLALDGPHWRFALDLYGKPGVGEACLTLQDAFGVDVAALLVALYAAAVRGLAVGPREAAALDASAALWRARAIEPIRSLRRDLKGVPGLPQETVEDFRASVKALELDAERIALALLARTLDGFATPAGKPRRASASEAGEAVVAFYRRKGGGPAADHRPILAIVVDAL
jgi:uncharacterized protein (TIGR02444 family)